MLNLDYGIIKHIKYLFRFDFNYFYPTYPHFFICKSHIFISTSM